MPDFGINEHIYSADWHLDAIKNRRELAGGYVTVFL
jgi:hypothetical protein